uniref:alpha-1,2-Mannosidase n=1 Tax=Glossina brevipalpis TaxID=37001 RepID=A0A1A9WIR3_9MUSC
MTRIGIIGRKCNLHYRRKCLIRLVLAILCLLCLGGTFLLSKQFQKAVPEIFVPAAYLAGHQPLDKSRHFLKDQQKLEAKIKEEFYEILDQPPLKRSQLIDEILPQQSDDNDQQQQGAAPPHLDNKSVGNIKLPLGGHADNDVGAEKRRKKIKEMMKHAWHNYKRYAWGENELRPLAKRGHTDSVFGTSKLGATIIDSLDTLYIMGLETEYKEGRNWIKREFNFDTVIRELSVFETNIRLVGGFLTMYAFTGDSIYKEKAQSVVDKLLPAFNTSTGIPHSLVNPKTGESWNYGWASGSILAEIGSLHLEFSYLSDITGNPLYREKVQIIRQILKKIKKPNGLYRNYINPITGKWGENHVSLGALGDSFYEYLLKAWLQSGQTDEEARQMFDNAMLAIIKHMVRTSHNGLTYVSNLVYERLEEKMEHFVCFAGGIFALAAKSRQDENSAKFMEIGESITNTCHESYVRSFTGLGPDSFPFGQSGEYFEGKNYLLRPETVESYFVLWRLTHNQKYRDWGWDVVLALEKYCRTAYGYSGIRDVYQKHPQKDDVQQSFFLAETLKYLYLLFSKDTLLPLNEWVFNTEAHPLPIKDANVYYRPALSVSCQSKI